MSDFPADQTPLFLSTFSSYGPQNLLRSTLLVGSVAGASVTWVANRAVYMPMMVPWEYTVNRVWWVNGSTTTTTNVDFGIYTPGGAKIYSTGSTAQGTASAPQYVTPSVPFVLPPGAYYFAWTCDNTTTRAFGNTLATAANGALAGLLSQSSALPLPATATFATYGTPGFQLCGVTRTQSGF